MANETADQIIDNVTDLLPAEKEWLWARPEVVRGREWTGDHRAAARAGCRRRRPS